MGAGSNIYILKGEKLKPLKNPGSVRAFFEMQMRPLKRRTNGGNKEEVCRDQGYVNCSFLSSIVSSLGENQAHSKRKNVQHVFSVPIWCAAILAYLNGWAAAEVRICIFLSLTLSDSANETNINKNRFCRPIRHFYENQMFCYQQSKEEP